MKILYSLPHPADHLDSGQAGHTVRARALLAALETLGATIVRVEAAASSESQTAVSAYRRIVRHWLPRPLALRLRDLARVTYSRRYAARLIEAARQHQPEVILETHIAFSLAGMLAAQHTGLPLALDDVAPPWEEEALYGVGARGLARRTYRAVTGHASLLVAVSGAIRALLIAEGLPAHKIVAIPNGISESLLRHEVNGAAQRAALGLPPGTAVVGFVGSFQPYHHVDWLIEAFARLPADLPAHLLLIGEGQRASAARAQVLALGLQDRVTFTGRVAYEQVAGALAAADIAIMPATNSYGNPMKLYDYLALGKAIVAPDQPTITEIVTDGETALLFAPENIPAMAQTLERLIRDEALRTRLGAQAAAAAPQHTWLQRGEQLFAALERIRGRSA